MTLLTSPGYVLIALAAASAASVATSVAIGLHPFAEAQEGFLGPIEFCGRAFSSVETRGVIASSVASAVLAFHALRAILAWSRSLSRLRQMESLIDVLSRSPDTSPMLSLLRRLGLSDRVFIVETDDSAAFTAGLFELRIYISRGAIERLSPDELEAVLWHEKHHLEQRDPLFAHVLAVLRAAIGYLPATHRLIRAFRRSREYQADDRVLQETGKVTPLLNAFLKLSSPRAAPAHAVGYSDFAEHRVTRLTTDGVAEVSDWKKVLVVSVSTVAALIALPALTLLLTEGHLLALVA